MGSKTTRSVAIDEIVPLIDKALANITAHGLARWETTVANYIVWHNKKSWLIHLGWKKPIDRAKAIEILNARKTIGGSWIFDEVWYAESECTTNYCFYTRQQLHELRDFCLLTKETRFVSITIDISAILVRWNK